MVTGKDDDVVFGTGLNGPDEVVEIVETLLGPDDVDIWSACLTVAGHNLQEDVVDGHPGSFKFGTPILGQAVSVFVMEHMRGLTNLSHVLMMFPTPASTILCQQRIRLLVIRRASVRQPTVQILPARKLKTTILDVQLIQRREHFSIVIKLQ